MPSFDELDQKIGRFAERLRTFQEERDERTKLALTMLANIEHKVRTQRTALDTANARIAQLEKERDRRSLRKQPHHQRRVLPRRRGPGEEARRNPGRRRAEAGGADTAFAGREVRRRAACRLASPGEAGLRTAASTEADDDGAGAIQDAVPQGDGAEPIAAEPPERRQRQRWVESVTARRASIRRADPQGHRAFRTD